MSDDELAKQAEALHRWMLAQRNRGVNPGHINDQIFEAVASIAETWRLWMRDHEQRTQ